MSYKVDPYLHVPAAESRSSACEDKKSIPSSRAMHSHALVSTMSTQRGLEPKKPSSVSTRTFVHLIRPPSESRRCLILVPSTLTNLLDIDERRRLTSSTTVIGRECLAPETFIVTVAGLVPSGINDCIAWCSEEQRPVSKTVNCLRAISCTGAFGRTLFGDVSGCKSLLPTCCLHNTCSGQE